MSCLLDAAPPSPPHALILTLVPVLLPNFKRVLAGWEEKLMQILGCHCRFIVLAYAPASLAERLLLQLGLSSLNWLPDPPPLQRLLQLRGCCNELPECCLLIVWMAEEDTSLATVQQLCLSPPPCTMRTTAFQGFPSLPESNYSVDLLWLSLMQYLINARV